MHDDSKCRLCGCNNAYNSILGYTECATRGCANYSQKQYDAVHGTTPAEDADDLLAEYDFSNLPGPLDETIPY